MARSEPFCRARTIVGRLQRYLLPRYTASRPPPMGLTVMPRNPRALEVRDGKVKAGRLNHRTVEVLPRAEPGLEILDLVIEE